MGPGKQRIFGMRGLPLGRYFGVQVVAHWSLLIILFLIAASLGAGVFPAWHPDWPPALVWTVAAIAAVLFMLSVAIHEMTHALVGRTQGIEVSRIMLFIFGGIAESRDEAESPKAEALTAGSGPLASLIIGFASLAAGVALAGTGDGDPEAMITGAGPFATILLWLGPINIVLAIFNMVPGFPLDGGRVLRALLWWTSGSLRKATEWSAAVGQGFGWILIGCGVLMLFGYQIPIFGGGAVGGMWLILIGWFLSGAARMSYQGVVVREALRGVPTQRVMTRSLVTVAPGTTLARLVDDHVMTSDQTAFPVIEDGRLLGLVHLEDIRRVSREQWPRVTVDAVMIPAGDLPAVSPDDDAADALRALGATRDAVPVIDHGELRGIVRRDDIARWLSFAGEPR